MKTSKPNSKTCQVFSLYKIASWIISNGSTIANQTTDQQKHTIILYYYSIFLCQDGGIVYILEQVFDCRKGHICSIHKPLVKSTFPRHFTSNTTSVPSSTKPTKIKHFITFNTIKNHQYSTLKSPQTLEK